MLEEIFVFAELSEGFSYSDIMNMPTYERKFFIGLLMKKQEKRQEEIDNLKSKASSSSSKGTKKSRISGDALKTKMKNGEIPLK